MKSEKRKLEFFTVAEAADLDAFCAQIIPSGDDGPGAREAGSLYFIDYVAKNTEPNLQPKFQGRTQATGRRRRAEEICRA